MNKNSEKAPEMIDVILFNGSDLIAPQNSSQLRQDPYTPVMTICLLWF